MQFDLGGLVGCSIALATLAFLAMLWATYRESGELGHGILAGTLVGAMVFIFSYQLVSQGFIHTDNRKRSVRRRLKTRHPIDTDEFIGACQQGDPSYLLATRRAIASFFGISETKIHPQDKLLEDYEIAEFEPDFHSFVLTHVIEQLEISPGPFVFSTVNLRDLPELAEEIRSTIMNLESRRKE